MRPLIHLKMKKLILITLLSGLIFYSFNILTWADLDQKTVSTINHKTPLTLAVFPRRNTKISFRMFTPLVEHLSRELGRKVNLVVKKDFKSFWSGVANQSYDIVHYNQYHYVMSHKKYNYHVIAKNVEFGEATIAGSIIVRNDAGIHSIADLRGKKIIFGGGPKAMQSYIAARYLLQQAGLNKGDYTEAFAKSPTNAIFAAYFRQSAAAGTGDKNIMLEIVKKRIDISKLKYLAKGEQLAHLPWAINGKHPLSLRNKIQILLTTLHKKKTGKAVLNSAELDELQIANDNEYNPHRKIIQAVYNEQY